MSRTAGWSHESIFAHETGADAARLPGRQAGLLDAARSAGPDPSRNAPGVVAYDAAARIVLRDSAAKAYLDDLQAGDAPDAAMPQAVAAALARLHWRPAGGQDSDEADDVALRAQGRSGRWYTLHAALSEPDEAGASRSVVILSPATATETAGILARLYGLARRERTVLLHLCRGRSTKEIAAELGPSAYTVQEYIRSACEKVGARDQKALVSRMLFDGKAAASLGAG